MRRVLLLAAIHLVITLAALLISIGFSGIDDEVPSTVSKMASPVVSVLMQPGVTVWDRIGKGQPDWIEWIVFGANSLVWGLGLSFLWSFVRRK